MFLADHGEMKGRRTHVARCIVSLVSLAKLITQTTIPIFSGRTSAFCVHHRVDCHRTPFTPCKTFTEVLHKSFTVLQRGRANDNRREHCAKKKTELTDWAQPTASSAMDLSRLPFLLVDLDDVRRVQRDCP